MLSFVVPKGRRNPMDVIVNPPLQVSPFRSETKFRLLSMFLHKKVMMLVNLLMMGIEVIIVILCHTANGLTKVLLFV